MRINYLCKDNIAKYSQSAEEIDPGYSRVQSYLTYAILGVSTVGLFLTIVLLPTEGLRENKSAKINICLSTALLLASLMFLLQDAFINVADTGIIKLVSS